MCECVVRLKVLMWILVLSGGCSAGSTSRCDACGVPMVAGSESSETGLADEGTTGQSVSSESTHGAVDPPPGSVSAGSGTGTESGGQGTGTPQACGFEGCPCAVAAVCESGLRCVDKTCVGVMNCGDEDEPNDSAKQAVHLGIVPDNADALHHTGVLSGEDDMDWYRYEGADISFFSSASPFGRVTGLGTVLCMYAVCALGDDVTELACLDGSIPSQHLSGAGGCCAPEDHGISMDFDCGGTGPDADNAAVLLSVSGTGVKCTGYELEYHF